MPVSGIFAPALAPAKMVPSPFTKLIDPSAKPPSHTMSLLEATSKPTCSQFVDSFRKSPNFTENFTPWRNLTHPGAGSLIEGWESLGSPASVDPLHCEILSQLAHEARGTIRPW